MSDEPSFPPPEGKSPWPAAVIGGLVHVGLWVLLFTWLGTALAEQHRLFEELAVQLPQASRIAIVFGRILSVEPVVAVMGLSVLLAVDVFLLARLGRGGYRVLRELWSGLMVGLPVFAFMTVAGSIVLAHTKLTQALTRPAATYAKAERAEYARLAGKWKLAAVERGGAPAEVASETLTITEGGFRWQKGGETFGGSFFPNVNRNPLGVTMVFGDAPGGQGPGTVRSGLYRVVGNSLEICLGPPDAVGEGQPADFSTKGTKNELLTFSKVE